MRAGPKFATGRIWPAGLEFDSCDLPGSSDSVERQTGLHNKDFYYFYFIMLLHTKVIVLTSSVIYSILVSKRQTEKPFR